MAYILILETATEVCSVAIAKDGKLLSLVESSEDYSHTSKLTTQIQKAIDNAEIKMEDLDAVAISAGPGSYTGLRVGSSTAKGICYGLDIPLIALESLEGLSYAPLSIDTTKTNFIISMIDARRDEVYAAVYDPNHHLLDPLQAIVLDGDSFSYFRKPGVIWHVVGNGAPKSVELLKFENLKVGPSKSSASHFVRMADSAWKRQDFVDLAYFSPKYHKAPNITKSKKNLF